MRVEMYQPFAPLRVANGKSCLLPRLAQCRFPRRLARFEMTAWLHPHADALVQVEHGASRSHHDRRAGDMNRIGILVKRVDQPVEL